MSQAWKLSKLAKMGSLLEEVKKAQEESYEKWFERWFEKSNLPKKIKEAAEKGFSAFVIDVKDFENDKYLCRRLSDDRVIDLLKSELPGFKIARDSSTRKGNFFGREMYLGQNNMIFIKW